MATSMSPVDLSSGKDSAPSSLEDPRCNGSAKKTVLGAQTTKKPSLPEMSNGIDPTSMFCLLQCQLCGFPVLDAFALQLHTITMHTDTRSPYTFANSITSPKKQPLSSSPSRKRPHSPTFPSGEFLCSQCDCNFPSLSAFVAHMRTQHLQSSPGGDKYPLACQICKSSFPTVASRLSHLSEHFIGTSSAFTCQQCGKQFESNSQYRQHFTVFHADILHRCNICLQIFTQNGAFQEHMVAHMSTETRYFCINCPGSSFETTDRFEAHVQAFHNKNTADIPRNCEEPGVQDPSSSAKSLKCCVCDKECSNDNALDEHKLMNHCKVPKGDQCAVCRQTLASVADFRSHMHLHSDGFGEMDCVVCRQRIRTETQLRMHVEYHLDLDTSGSPTPPKCPICCEFVPPQDLTKHLLNHASECYNNGEIKQELEDQGSSEAASPSHPQLICHCGQQFDDENELTAHALEHLNETLPGCSTDLRSAGLMFDCPRCPKRFTSLSALQGHSHIHMAPKYRCTRCSQTFSSSFRLQQHKLKHASKNDLKCRICDKKFALTDELQSHMLIHENSLTSFASTLSNQTSSFHDALEA